ncbi:hypothetical protein F5Y17DRAFT_182103 [Xylariaceae sp. FL0594]|nr:hypothetical protein F5Y17DRAFT_182103 [Xylariaceae sp. FL0594]
MPAFVDWNSLLFGSSPEPGAHQQVASHSDLDASNPDDSEAWSSAPEPLGPLTSESTGSEGESSTPELGQPEDIVSGHAVLDSLVSGNAIPGDAGLRSAASQWNAASQNANVRLSYGGIFLATILIWFWLGRRKRSQAPPKQLTGPEENVDSVKRELAQRTEALERQFDEALKRKVEALEEQFRKMVDEQVENVEEHVRKSFNKRVEELEVRIKLDQQALDDVHRAVSERMDAFEGYVRTIDSKQLDQEANSIAQRTLGQRLDAVEETCRNGDNKTRASAQRVEAIDDSVRVIDSRVKALSQRLEAAEDNLNSTEGQVTLLSHDVNRGSSVIEKLQRTVKMLPDNDKFKTLSRTLETRIKKLETKLEEAEKTLEEHLAEPPPTLSWSHIESVEIEPVGPVYTRPHAPSFDGSIISPSSSSVRSLSTSSSHARSYSTMSSHPPMTPERKRIDTVGFRETTFSSRQKLLASTHRSESWAP